MSDATPHESFDAEPQPEGREPWFKFAATFAALAVGFELFYYGLIVDGAIHSAYLETLAFISAKLLSLYDVSIRNTGAAITGGGFSIQVAQSCDALQTCALLSAAVLAFPATLASRLRGVVFGVLFLQAVNIARISSLHLIGAHWRSQFEHAHEVVWPFVIIFLTVTAWILWVRQQTPADEEPAAAAA